MSLALYATTIVQAAPLTVTDKRGVVVSINAPVKRAIIHINYEIIPALCIWDRVVGMGSTAFTNDLVKATMPTTRHIPIVGEIDKINVERVASLKADLLITWNYNNEELLFIEQNGKTKVVAFYPESLDEFYSMLRTMGTIFGKEKEATVIIEQMEKIFALVREKTTDSHSNKKRTVLWLGSKPTVAIGRSEPKNDIVEMAGAVNVGATINRHSAEVSMEQIIAWNPDVIFITGHATFGVKDIVDNSQWKYIKAVQSGNVYKAPEWSTWSPRLAPVTLWMASKIYPERYRDVNQEEIIEDFFRSVFHIPYAKVKQIEK